MRGRHRSSDFQGGLPIPKPYVRRRPRSQARPREGPGPNTLHGGACYCVATKFLPRTPRRSIRRTRRRWACLVIGTVIDAEIRPQHVLDIQSASELTPRLWSIEETCHCDVRKTSDPRGGGPHELAVFRFKGEPRKRNTNYGRRESYTGRGYVCGCGEHCSFS